MLTKKIARFFFTGATVFSAGAVWADGGSSLSLETGAHYNTGNYGTAIPTRIKSVPLTIGYESLPWTLKLTIPYISISGADNVIAGLGSLPNTTPLTRTASGLGDIVAAATYNIYNNGISRLGIDLTAKIKLGTGDRERGLGTGKNDYGTQVDLYQNTDRWTFFGSLGYSIMGSSELIPLADVFNAGIGATYALGAANIAGLMFDYRQKESPTNPSQRELTVFLTHKIDKTWKTQTYLLKGFSDGSPEWGGGLSVTYVF